MTKKKLQKNKVVYDEAMWVDCGYKQISNGNFKEARVCFEQAIIIYNKKLKKKDLRKQFPYAHPYFGIGISYLIELNYEKAILYFEKCLELDPNFFYATRKLAEVYTELLNKSLNFFAEKQEEFQKISEEKGINMKEEVMNDIRKYTSLSMEWLNKSKELEEKLGVGKNMVDLKSIINKILEKK
jgi:tetratricopeptide (TPR) repeat protein